MGIPISTTHLLIWVVMAFPWCFNFNNKSTTWSIEHLPHSYPLCSMYRIFTYIWDIVNVTKYSIHIPHPSGGSLSVWGSPCHLEGMVAPHRSPEGKPCPCRPCRYMCRACHLCRCHRCHRYHLIELKWDLAQIGFDRSSRF